MIDKDMAMQRLCYNEGISLKPYICSEGKLTIGVGRCLDTNPLNEDERAFIGHNARQKTITKAQAFYLLRNDLNEVMKCLDEKLPWWRNLNDDRGYVLIDMCFQMGINGLLSFKNTLNYLANGNYEAASENLLKSKYAKQTFKRAKRNADCIKSGRYRI